MGDRSGGPPTDAGSVGEAAGERGLRARARRILTEAWRADPAGGGFCVPHAGTYPWQWLWDSCFHAVVWAHLGDERAVAEVACALAAIDDDGFVPHMRYAGAASPHERFWGRSATSSITQPPMYGHALAEAVRCGLAVDDRLLEAATRGLRFLLDRRARTDGGLVSLCHPWESGCDDSPRWDDLCPGGWDAKRWYERKGTLLATVQRTAGGAPIANPPASIGSAGFNALVAFNAAELAGLTGDADLQRGAAALAEALDDRWDPDLATWVDDGVTSTSSGRVRTHDALLPALVTRLPVTGVLAPLADPAAHGGRFGPTGVHRAEATFEPDRYWRGSSWPQLTYLSWLAAARSGSSELASSLRSMLVAGAVTSGFSEHWDPDTGSGLGASPQSWTTIAWVVAARGGREAPARTA